MSFNDLFDDYDDVATEGYGVSRRLRSLQARAHLHPQDPDALSEEEIEELEALEAWEP